MRSFAPLLVLLAVACKPDDASEEGAILATKEVVSEDLHELEEAAIALQEAAPAPSADGWGASPSLDASKTAWKDARVAYERIEGAIAVLFPDLDASTDERYDGFIAEGPDADLFDGEHVTGVHAIERIVWADAHPAHVVAFESALTNYTEAAWPATEAEAAAYRDDLAQRLVDDVETMHADFDPLALDAAAAYEGVIGSMAEQIEKVALGATGEDESRYAQHTLADMRANLAGGKAIYEAFSPWIVADGDAGIDAEVLDGFDRVSAAYEALEGDALPAVPATWNPDAPSEADLATPYGELWSLLQTETDPAVEGSLVERMVAAAASVDLEVNP